MDIRELQVTTTQLMGPKLEVLRQRALIAGIAGLVLCGAGYAMGGAAGFYPGYLIGFLFWVGISGGSLALLMLHHVVGGGWGFLLRRFLEAGTKVFPIVAVLFIPVVIGMFSGGLYAWNTPAAASDVHIQAKAGYLNPVFWVVRSAIYLLAWIGMSSWLRKLGDTQNERSDAEISNRLNLGGGVGLILYAILVTFAAVDWLLSLTPKWVSSIVGLLGAVSQTLSALAVFLALVAFLAGSSAVLRNSVMSKYFRDLGNLMLAMVMLWAYMSFSQYLITYSGNTVEEAQWYVDRSHAGWHGTGVALIVFHFAVPFFVLLIGSTIKKDPLRLAKVAVAIIAMRWVDLFYWVRPTFSGQSFAFNLADLGGILLVGGVWLFFWAKALENQPVVPLHDPRFQTHLHEVVSHG